MSTWHTQARHADPQAVAEQFRDQVHPHRRITQVRGGEREGIYHGTFIMIGGLHRFVITAIRNTYIIEEV